MNQTLTEESRPRRRVAAVLAAIAYLGVATALLVLWRLPAPELAAALSAAAQSRGGHRLELSESRVGWWGQLQGQGVALGLRGGGGEIGVRLDSLSLQPGWWSFLRGRPRIGVTATRGPGRISGRLGWMDRSLSRLEAVSLQVDGMELTRLLDADTLAGGRVTGGVEAVVRLSLPGGDPSSWSGRAVVSFDGLFLQGVAFSGFTLERLPLGRGGVELELAEGSGQVELTRCEAGGSEVELRGRGAVTLASRLPQSRLQLGLEIRLSGATQASLGELLAIMGYRPAPDGWTRVQISGTLGRPRAGPGS